jgi:hypothetical protein
MKKFAITALAALAIIGAEASDAGAASAKKKYASRSDYTAEQRHKIMLYALEVCRKKYGRTALRYANIDYRRRRVMCYIY